MLIIAVITGIAYAWYFFGQNYAGDAVLKHLFTNVYLWTAVIAILGCGKAWFDKTSKFSVYMTKSSFGIYIVHYIIVLSACYYLKLYTALPVFAIYLIASLTVLAASPALYELLKRIPILRYLVLGIKKTKSTVNN
jgi:peptidoglycan/LPS O-acetylase OafA/YrhL